jgi:O-antigen/teichoic acid export membrane protein
MAPLPETLLDCPDLRASTPTPDNAAAVSGEATAWQAAGWGLVATVATALLSYAFQIAIARVMSDASYSETLAMLSLYMVCSLSLSPIFLLITRRVVEAVRQGRDADVRALLLTLGRRGTLASVAFVGVAFVARAPLAAWLAVSDPLAPPLLALSLATSSLYLLVVAVLLGRMNWRMANSLPVLFGVTRIALSLVLVRDGFEVGGTLAAITGAAVLCLSIGCLSAVRRLGTGGRYQPLHLGEVGLAIALNAAFWFLVEVDRIYVNRDLPALAAEGYAAASSLGKMLVYIPVAIGNVLFPLLAAARDASSRRAVLFRMIGLAVALDAVGLLALALAPEQILLLTLGPEHIGAATFLFQVGAVLAPLSLAGMLLYDALARHDRVVVTIFAIAAIGGATALAVMPPSLPGLFTVLLASTAVICGAGLVRTFFSTTRTAP